MPDLLPIRRPHAVAQQPTPQVQARLEGPPGRQARAHLLLGLRVRAPAIALLLLILHTHKPRGSKERFLTAVPQSCSASYACTLMLGLNNSVLKLILHCESTLRDTGETNMCLRYAQVKVGVE